VLSAWSDVGVEEIVRGRKGKDIGIWLLAWLGEGEMGFIMMTKTMMRIVRMCLKESKEAMFKR
jgi:hypothetical protein